LWQFLPVRLYFLVLLLRSQKQLGGFRRQHRRIGSLWGAGTGERAQKYQISPSLKLGFIYQTPVGSGAHLSIRLTSVLGGRMAERPCLASYLEQEEYANVKVNCRLAAAQLQPAETLKYLTHALPPDRNNASIRYTVVF